MMKKRPKVSVLADLEPKPKPAINWPLETAFEEVRTAATLYAAGSEKLGEMMGMAKVIQGRAKKAQLWKAFYEAQKSKEVRLHDLKDSLVRLRRFLK
jgi:hypothetical protein